MKKYILFIDSGIGGLSTLAKTILLTKANFIYFADTKHSPYGNKSTEFLHKRLQTIIYEQLKKHPVEAVVLACNTATTTCINLLRQDFPYLQIIGTEPAIKLAFDSGFTKPAVIATPQTIHQLTIKNNKLNLIPCNNLAMEIESYLHCPTIKNKYLLLKTIYLIQSKTRFNDCLVLGCTHYPLIKSQIKHICKKTIFDGNAGVAKQIASILPIHEQKFSVKFVLSNKNSTDKQKYKKILKQILAKQIKL